VQAAADHDYTMIMGVTVVVALVTILANLLTDLIYTVVDPRITHRS
jgi:ABC-type dipeptide/oligopeptide/nickel transport system permease component